MYDNIINIIINSLNYWHSSKVEKIESWIPTFVSIKLFCKMIIEKTVITSPILEIKFISFVIWLYNLVWMFSGVINMLFRTYNIKFIFYFSNNLNKSATSFSLKFISKDDLKIFIKSLSFKILLMENSLTVKL